MGGRRHPLTLLGLQRLGQARLVHHEEHEDFFLVSLFVPFVFFVVKTIRSEQRWTRKPHALGQAVKIYPLPPLQAELGLDFLGGAEVELGGLAQFFHSVFFEELRAGGVHS